MRPLPVITCFATFLENVGIILLGLNCGFLSSIISLSLNFLPYNEEGVIVCGNQVFKGFVFLFEFGLWKFKSFFTRFIKPRNTVVKHLFDILFVKVKNRLVFISAAVFIRLPSKAPRINN